jgi:ribulose-phosphate 3-epimerase
MKFGYSIIASNILDLKKDIDNFYFVDFLHIDIMDGHFVQDISIGHNIINDIKKYYPNKFIDIHIMTTNPTNILDKLINANRVFIHIESLNDNFKIDEFISFSKKNNITIGLAISPETSIYNLLYYLDKIKNVMIMSVKPGKCGQQFIPETINKINIIKKNFPDTTIQVDGGVCSTNIKLLYDNNVDSVICGSSLHREKNIIGIIKYYKKYNI